MRQLLGQGYSEAEVAAARELAATGADVHRGSLDDLDSLRNGAAAADGVICLPNQKVFKLIDEHTSVIETFDTTNELLAQGVRNFAMLIVVGEERNSAGAYAAAVAHRRLRLERSGS